MYTYQATVARTGNRMAVLWLTGDVKAESGEFLREIAEPTQCPEGHLSPLQEKSDEQGHTSEATLSCKGFAKRMRVVKTPKRITVFIASQTPAAPNDATRFFDSIRIVEPTSKTDDPTRGWRTVRSAKRRFDIDLPNDPTTSTRQTEKGTSFDMMVSAVDSGARFIVAALDVDGDPKDAANAIANGMAAADECSGRIMELPQWHATGPLRRQVYCMNGTTLLLDAHSRGHTVYAVVASVPPDADVMHVSEYMRFRLSFRTLEDDEK
jgi:hypothetical protein